jgi:hypothetical protein
MTDLESVAKRVVQLETRLRWMTRAAILSGILITAGALLAQVRGLSLPGEVLPNGQLRTESQPRVNPSIEAEVRAQHFILVDSRGKERASLVADNAGSVFLVMFDTAGKTRVNLSTGNEGPSLLLYDSAGRERTIIGSTTLVGSHVNENGIAEKSPPSSIVLFDKSGKLVWRQP